jgi:hypothetical protein
MAAAREHLRKRVPAEMDTLAAIEVLLEAGFSTAVRAKGL